MGKPCLNSSKMFFVNQHFWCLPAVLLTFVTLSCAVIVELPVGKIQGFTSQTINNKTFNSFLSVPYAKPPVGDLRFELAQPFSWNGTAQATKKRNTCYQSGTSGRQSEDCLFMHIYTPKNLTAAPVKADLPVILYVHGGGFGSGFSGSGPNNWMDQDIVMITFQYRLGIFGFATTGDTLIPGNLGLKDQLFALQWVQQNVAYFGGNPTKVTLYGQSAGSASVSYQLLNPKTRGHYRAAILESGSAINPWAFQRYQAGITQITAALTESKVTASDLPNIDLEKNNTYYKSTNELYTLLKSVSSSVLATAAQQVYSKLKTAYNFPEAHGFFYAPVIEPEHDGAFITEHQYELYKAGKYNQVPVLIGINDEEGLMVYNIKTNKQLFGVYDTDPASLVPWGMHITDKSNKTKVGQLIKDFYVPNGNFADNLVLGIKYHTTQDFHNGIIKQAEFQAQFSEVFFYNFNYSGIMGNNLKKRLAGTSNVTHSEQIEYYYSHALSAAIPDNTNMSYFPVADQKVHFRYMNLWSNFIKFLNPTPKREEITQNIIWPKVEVSAFKYLEIGENLEVRTAYPNNYYQFWQDLYNDYAIPPLDSF